MLQILGIKCEEGTEDFKKYNCDKCDYRTNDNGNFSRHMNSKHSAIAKETMLSYLSLSLYFIYLSHFSCDNFDYRTNDNGNFSRHMNSKHSAIAKETMLSYLFLSVALSLSIYLTSLVKGVIIGLMGMETLVDT